MVWNWRSGWREAWWVRGDHLWALVVLYLDGGADVVDREMDEMEWSCAYGCAVVGVDVEG